MMLLSVSSLLAHSVEHEFHDGAMAVKLLLGSEPASFAPYTLYAPNASFTFSRRAKR